MIEAGLIVLSVKPTDESTLEARSGEHHISADADDLHGLISTVHQLLIRSGVVVSSGKAGSR
jgi:hypothetical protein